MANALSILLLEPCCVTFVSVFVFKKELKFLKSKMLKVHKTVCFDSGYLSREGVDQRTSQGSSTDTDTDNEVLGTSSINFKFMPEI